MHQTILILDFGSQYTQLIARRLRELSVYTEILPFDTPVKILKKRGLAGLILSGGPSSVSDKSAPHCDPDLLGLDIPILGICYGMQEMAHLLGGSVATASEREYGHATITTCNDGLLFENIPPKLRVWASHGDLVSAAPSGFSVTAISENAPIVAMENLDKKRFGLLFHPEVGHTERGGEILKNFSLGICGCVGDWTIKSFVDEATDRIKEQVGDTARVLCGLSGGVDSTVTALLIHRAIGERLTCVFVDNGLLRKNEREQVENRFKKLDLHLVVEDSSDLFLERLSGVTDPERKRKIIGASFIDVFEKSASEHGEYEFLAQGTLYPDVIESVSVVGPSAAIKSHHNVGGLPSSLSFELVEPLRELFKDEVREVGRELGLESEFVWRQPFPGPGLAVRILGEVDAERTALLREADAVVSQEIRRADLYRRVWQSFAVLLPIRSVGVMGDERTYEYTIAVRAVESTDGMTADWARLPHDLLATISSRIVNEVKGVNRVVYDISSKPPSTIEWE